MKSDCVFCKIVAGDIPSYAVDENDRAVAFLDAAPATRGHMLVVPRKHVSDILTIDLEDLSVCSALAQKMAMRATDRLEADGVSLLHSCGTAAGQTVFHFHMHVIPRYRGNSLGLPWSPTSEVGEILEATANQLRTENGA